MASKKTVNQNRRDVLLNGARTLSAIFVGGMTWSVITLSTLKATPLLRPPGARMEKDFLKSCIRCGLCVNACPYGTLRLATIDSNIPFGTPYFVAREVPCYMCEDVPCVPPCPTDALDETLIISKKDGQYTLNIAMARMGVAVVDTYACIAYWGVQCDACYRVCPLIDEAITLEYKFNERTGKHTYALPIVHNEVCTGCGKCELACVTDKASITVIERESILGIADSHYIKSWDKRNEERSKDTTKIKPSNTTDQTMNIQEYVSEDL